MSEAGSTTDAASQITSLTPVESTRASTPTEAPEIEETPQPTTPKFIDLESASEDVPMRDISPGKHEQSPSPRMFDSPGEALSPRLEGLKLPTAGGSA